MKYCNKCGNKIEHSVKFCNKCGNKIILSEKQSSEKIHASNEKSLNNNNNSINTNNNDNHKKFNHNNDYTNKASINELDKTMAYDKENNNYHNPNILNTCKDNERKSSDTIINKENYDYYDKTSPKKKKNKYIVIGIIISITLATASFLYFSKDSMLYTYYYNKANSATSTFEKLTNYNNALKHNYNADIIDSIYNTLKNEPSFIDEIPKVSNLNEEDTNNLIYKLCTFNADENFNNENYDLSLSYLNLAKEYGYNEKEYINYDKLTQKLKESNEKNTSADSTQNVYDFKNDAPIDNMPNNIYDYTGDYLLPYSDSTYINKSDIKQYNKETLALMRNEIYARHGYIFELDTYKSYFNSKSWYTPDSSFKGTDKELNEYELKNVKTIKSVEDTK